MAKHELGGHRQLHNVRKWRALMETPNMNSFAASSNSTSVGLVDGLRQGWLLRKSALPIAAATLAFVALLSSFQYVVRQGVEAGDARRADAARQSQELWRSAYAKPALTPQQANQVIVGGSVHAVSKALR